GDTVDNVPGVTKCGPKTAAKWIAEYGSLDGVIDNAASMGGKIGEYLREALAHLPLSRQLVTIKTDVELDVGVRDLALSEADVESLCKLIRRDKLIAVLKDVDSMGADKDADSTEYTVSAKALPASPIASRLASLDHALAEPGDYELIVDVARFNAW